mgnify:CR=1 FL=1
MKVALVNDYLKEYGGAERVLEALHDMYPDAPVFTLVYSPQFLGPHKERFASWDIRQSFLRFLPFNYKFISLYRLIAPLVFKSFDFSGFDVIIVSATGAYCPNMIDKKQAKQICYCHTPPRYLYGYATAREWKKNKVLRFLGEYANHFLRMVDFTSSKHVDLFIANSENIARRIKKFYRRDSIVIYPPVVSGNDVTTIKSEKRTYFLTGGRLARPKHIDLIIQTCNDLKIPLKVFGKGFAGYGDELTQLAGSSVSFLGEVSDEEKLELMRHAKAFIFAGEDEDFGIIPVEAMSMGTPVIAYKSGGLLETVVEGKTGLFFSELTVASLAQAIKKFQKLRFDPDVCAKYAQKFSYKVFTKSISAQINIITSS